MRKNSPARLYKKQEPRGINIPPILVMLIIIAILGALAIAMAVACTSPYNMAWA